ncbi:MAG: AsmA family protein, partial [Deltaproteobacteria bacterium]|nr:AsmA family protein [Deltaproteobacteria bacterium]
GGRPGEPPLVVVPQARASVHLWALLRSAGREVSLSSVSLLRPRINLVRNQDGTWSHQDLLQGGGSETEREVLVSDLHVRDGGLYVIDRSGPNPDEAVAMRHIDLRAADLGGPAMRFEVSAALASEKPNLKAKLAQKEGAWSGTLSVDPLSVANLRGLLPAGVDHALTAGTVALRADLTTGKDGATQVKGHVDAPELSLRGAQASGAFDFLARLPPGASASPTVDITHLRLNGPGVVDLTGEAALRGKPLTASFSLAGPLLDLGVLMNALPSEEGPSDTSGTIPASMRKSIASLGARGQLKVDKLIVKKLSAQNVVADAQLQDGVVTLSRATADLYGGSLSATGTRLDLRQPLPLWELRGQLGGVNVGTAMQQVAGTSPLTGSFEGEIDLRGQGAQWSQLQKSMTGQGSFKVNDGALMTADLAQAISGPIGEALKIAGKSSALAQGGSGASQSTPLRGLQGSFTVKNGQLVFSRPITARSTFGELSIAGSVGLDQQLDLQGTAQLSPQFLSQTTGFNPGRPIAAPLSLTGPLDSPQVHVDSGAVARELLKQSPPGELFEKGIRGLFGGESRQQ